MKNRGNNISVSSAASGLDYVKIIKSKYNVIPYPPNFTLWAFLSDRTKMSTRYPRWRQRGSGGDQLPDEFKKTDPGQLEAEIEANAAM